MGSLGIPPGAVPVALALLDAARCGTTIQNSLLRNVLQNVTMPSSRCPPIHPNFLQLLTNPEGPARHLDVPGQKLSPHCLETIFDSQLPSPKSSPKMPPKLSLTHRRGHFFLFQNYPCGEGNCEAIERQKLSRGNFCPRTS